MFTKEAILSNDIVQKREQKALEELDRLAKVILFLFFLFFSSLLSFSFISFYFTNYHVGA